LDETLIYENKSTKKLNDINVIKIIYLYSFVVAFHHLVVLHLAYHLVVLAFLASLGFYVWFIIISGGFIQLIYTMNVL